MSARVIEGDCLSVMAEIPAASIDACVTDPPYGLEFMGKAWDHGVPGEPYWQEVLRVLKPGGYLLAFGGTRTYHRLACAIEDSGFQIRDCLIWLYGSGFPKGKGCLKPGWEPIVLARKPGPSPWLNVDGCRIQGVRQQHAPFIRPDLRGARYCAADSTIVQADVVPDGRWPANVVLDEEAAALLDAQSGERATSGNVNPTNQPLGYRGSKGRQAITINYRDRGGASRYFYCAKASPSERGAFNDHPTVKPLALMRWLVRLVTPVGGTVLDPFCGSGSTLLAAQREGFDCIGIDADPHAVEITRRRLADAAGPLFAEEAVS